MTVLGARLGVRAWRVVDDRLTSLDCGYNSCTSKLYKFPACVWPTDEPLVAQCYASKLDSSFVSGQEGFRQLCLQTRKRPPTEQHDCGIYLARDENVLTAFLDGLWSWAGIDHNQVPLIYGIAAVWGRVIEGLHGMIGEYALPLKLWCRRNAWPTVDRATLKRLNDVYGLPPDERSYLKMLRGRGVWML